MTRARDNAGVDLASSLAGKEARSFGVKNDPTAGFYCLPGAAFVGQTTIPLSNAGRPYFVAFNNPRTWQITDVQVIVNVASGTAGTLARIGLYQASAWASAPDVLTLVTDFGTVDVSALGAKTIALGTPYTMTPGVYWVCVVQAVDATSGASLAGINAATPDAFMAMVLISNGWRSYSSLEVAANWTANVSSGLPSSATGAQNAVASNTTNQNPHAVLFRGSPA